MLESSFDRYDPLTGPPPTRPRTGSNPLAREEYLRRVTGPGTIALNESRRANP